jgi:hypothetical protein
VLAPDEPVGRERRERRQRVRRADVLVGAPVHELQELHRELDVAQPALPQLDLPVGLRRRHVVLDAAAHGLRVLDEVRTGHRAPHEGRHGLPIRAAELGVARDRPGLEQGLELPRLGPPLVVREVARERAHERSLLALGPQRGIDGP